MRPRFCKQAKSSDVIHFTQREKDEGWTDFKSSKEERTAKEIVSVGIKVKVGEPFEFLNGGEKVLAELQ